MLVFVEVTRLSDFVVDLSEYERVKRLRTRALQRVYLYRCYTLYWVAKFIECRDERGHKEERAKHVWKRERDSLFRLYHPSIVELHGFCSASAPNRKFVLLTRYVRGRTLQSVLHESPA